MKCKFPFIIKKEIHSPESSFNTNSIRTYFAVMWSKMGMKRQREKREKGEMSNGIEVAGFT